MCDLTHSFQVAAVAAGVTRSRTLVSPCKHDMYVNTSRHMRCTCTCKCILDKYHAVTPMCRFATQQCGYACAYTPIRVHIYTHIYIYVYTCIYACVFVCRYEYIDTYIHIYTYIDIHVNVHIHM